MDTAGDNEEALGGSDESNDGGGVHLGRDDENRREIVWVLKMG